MNFQRPPAIPRLFPFWRAWIATLKRIVPGMSGFVRNGWSLPGQNVRGVEARPPEILHLVLIDLPATPVYDSYFLKLTFQTHNERRPDLISETSWSGPIRFLCLNRFANHPNLYRLV